MKLIRHKQFTKDWNKKKMTEGQFNKFVHFSYCLQSEKALPPEAKDHSLIGHLNQFREFHLGGDLLVLYKVDKEAESIFFARLGTHAQLFE